MTWIDDEIEDAGNDPRRKGASPPADSRSTMLPIATLLVVSPIGAELLAAYSDSTGRPAKVLFGLVFFAALYGCPALLAREAARRTGRGWPTMLLIAAALGILEAGVIDQSLFAEQDDTVRGWEESVRRTYIDPLGLSAFNALNFVPGHVIYSFAAPIAIAEAVRPAVGRRPWLRRRGLAIAALAWLAAAVLIVSDLDSGAARRGTALEVAAALALVATLVLAAFCLPRSRRPSSSTGAVQQAASVASAGAGGFIVATAMALPPDTWLGVALLVPISVGGGLWLAWVARAGRWGLAHAAAAGTGALISRGALAFLYYPLVGEVEAVPKYAHNVVMLLAVAAAGLYAVRRAYEHDSPIVGPSVS